MPSGVVGLAAGHVAKRADFGDETASKGAQQVANWVVRSSDNSGMPFVIVDKINAKIFVFDSNGLLLGAAPVLLGLAIGDGSVPGIGDRKLSTLLDSERTTPAVRFVASLDHNLHGKEIFWVDYDAAISLHPVITTIVKDRRLQRLASPSPLKRRISYSCINVPSKFYANVVSRAFSGTQGIVYVLPEVRSIEDVSASYSAEAGTQLPAANGSTQSHLASLPGVSSAQ